jgi:NDP-sugar pyrophosphorylase family protein
VNYRHEVITDFFGDGSRYELNISYIHEDEPMGTVGALSLMQNRPKEPFVVMNGDLVSQLKLATLLRFHRETDALATICGREYLLNIPYGVIEIDGSNFLGISEKPTISRFVNAGIYVLSPKVLDLITERERLDMPDLLDRIKRMQHRVSVFPIMEYWRDIGRFEDLEEVRQEFLQN